MTARRYVIARAQESDLSDLLALRAEAERWLHARGIEQWTSDWSDRARERIRQGVSDGRTWIVRNDSDTAATVTLDGPDMDFWSDADDPHSALYLYKFIVARSHAGIGLGDALLDWACQQAAAADKQWLRIDVWRNNRRLQEYYLRRGFTHVRTVQVPWRQSGALFQRPAGTALCRHRIELHEPAASDTP